MDNRRIGIFDSGLGGLTVAHSIIRKLPEEKIVYFGDTARTPYGSKNLSTIERFVKQIADFLIKNDIKMLVIACNTVSATCKKMLEERYPNVEIVDVISPMVGRICKDYADNNIGIIGTKVTIDSCTYENDIHKINPKINIASQACPIFVPIIEEGIKNDNVIESAIKYYLDDFVSKNKIDSLVLGCTHYPLILNNIKKIYPSIEYLNPSEEVVSRIEKILKEKDMNAKESKLENLFFASDMSNTFVSMLDMIDKGAKPQFKQLSEY